jgi:RHS repeat-associated protein
MVRDGVEWFGAMTPNIPVQVDPPDTTPPTVTSFSPSAGATNVNANANVTVTFSEAMDAATVNGSTVELRDPSNALVSATVSYDAGSLTATLNPNASLAVGVTYTARVRGGGTDPRVKDVAGNALAADLTWTFTTAQNGSGGIKWLVTDHLGSTRMVIDETGNLEGVRRHDFAPFGEELFAGPAIRSVSNGYSADSTRQKFDAYERDSETGLDFAQARYYASLQGRFTSPDPLLSSGIIYDPQSWNRYSFTLNNPLRYTDPSGLFVWSNSLGGSLSDDQLREVANRFEGSDRQIYLDVIARRQAFRNERAQAERARDALPAGAERDSVSASLASYGAEGVVNGVSVGQGLLADNVAAEARTSYFPFDTNTNTFTAQVEVVLNNRGSGNLAIDIAHEGRHVADAQAFAGALTADLANQGVNAIAGPLNRTRYDREVRAYLVSSYVAQGLGLPNLNYGGREVWNSGWRAADRATRRSTAIDTHLRESPTYRLTPNTAEGARYIPR